MYIRTKALNLPSDRFTIFRRLSHPETLSTSPEFFCKTVHVHQEISCKYMGNNDGLNTNKQINIYLI